MVGQWGDEGKGKLSDVLAKNYDIVGRFNGGDNAGHTVRSHAPPGCTSPPPLPTLSTGPLLAVRAVRPGVQCARITRDS